MLRNGVPELHQQLLELSWLASTSYFLLHSDKEHLAESMPAIKSTQNSLTICLSQVLLPCQSGKNMLFAS
jgi:hypothetical protein